MRVFLGRGNGDGPCGAEHEVQQRHLEDVVIHHKAHRAAHGTGQNQRVHEADVVADQHAGAFFRDVLQPLVADAVQRVGGDPHQEAHHELGQQAVDVRGDQQVQQGSNQQHGRDADPHACQDGGKGGAGHHEQRVQDIVGRNGARAERRGGAALDQRI